MAIATSQTGGEPWQAVEMFWKFEMVKRGSITLVAFVISLLSSAASFSQSAVPPVRDCSAPQYRQLDYFVGDWDVFPTGQSFQTATSRIERIMKDCAIRESFQSLQSNPRGDYAGTSYSVYDRKDGKWHQFYVDVTGSATFYTGELVGSVMTLTAPGRGGSLQKMSYVPMPDGSVRQVGLVSTDEGKTWIPGYDLTYRHKRF